MDNDTPRTNDGPNYEDTSNDKGDVDNEDVNNDKGDVDDEQNESNVCQKTI